MLKNIHEMLSENAKRFPRRKAVFSKRKALTYRTLNTLVDRCASSLVDLGISKEDKVAVLSKNCLQVLISYFAILRAVATVVPVNYMLKEPEVEYILKDAGINCIIVSSEHLDMVRNISSKLESLRSVIVIGEKEEDALSFSSLLKAEPKKQYPETDPEETAFLIYTSGTTGYPKGVMLTHKNLISNVISAVDTISVTRKDRFLCFLPMFHSFTLTVCLFLPLYRGAAVTIIESVIPFSRVVRSLLARKVTIFVAIPPVYNVLSSLELPRIFNFWLFKKLIPLRLCISGAASLPIEVLHGFEKKFHIPLLEGYGLTEASPVVSINPLNGETKEGSVGLSIPGVEVKVVDSKGRSLDSGKPGELLVRGSNVMKGYYKNEEATRETIKDGWLYTGDIATIDSEGYVYIVDRKKDMINVRGQNVYPREIEEVLYQHPKIAEAAVIGVKDDLRGEVPKAFIILKKRERASKGEFIYYLRDRLASYKVPRNIEIKETLPKSITGKILKKALK